MRPKNKSNKKKKGTGVCLWSNIELLFDVAKSGVGKRKLNKLDLRILSARRELLALKKRGIEGIELLDILNREGCTRRVGQSEVNRHVEELRAAFENAATAREETHTIEIPRWIMNAMSAGKFTVSRGITLLFYMYRRLVKTKSHFKNWIKVGQAYGRFKLEDLKTWCGIHLSRASESLRWLQRVGIIGRAWVPFYERMKRGFCYVDGFTMKKNGNNFGRNRKPCHRNPKNQLTYKETNKERTNFSFGVDERGRLIATKT